ncbi:MAG: proteasome assembly chaperone family protein [Candidatus Micrarchaeia archaeon]
MIKLRLIGKHNFNGYTLVEGFPGYGLVGTIAVNFLVEKLGMEFIGYVDSQLFPPVVAIHNNRPLPSLRMYKSDKNKLIVVMSEFVMSIKSIHALSDLLYDWCEKNKIKRIISLGGISIKGKQDEVYGIVSSPDDVKLLSKFGVVPIKEGATTGINAMLLMKASVGGKVPVISLLAEARPDYVDPLGAAMVLTTLSDIIGVNINTEELVREALQIEQKLRSAIDTAKNAEKVYSGGESSGMYA